MPVCWASYRAPQYPRATPHTARGASAPSVKTQQFALSPPSLSLQASKCATSLVVAAAACRIRNATCRSSAARSYRVPAALGAYADNCPMNRCSLGALPRAHAQRFGHHSLRTSCACHLHATAYELRRGRPPGSNPSVEARPNSRPRSAAKVFSAPRGRLSVPPHLER